MNHYLKGMSTSRGLSMNGQDVYTSSKNLLLLASKLYILDDGESVELADFRITRNDNYYTLAVCEEGKYYLVFTFSTDDCGEAIYPHDTYLDNKALIIEFYKKNIKQAYAELISDFESKAKELNSLNNFNKDQFINSLL